jgi:hypothetical protein
MSTPSSSLAPASFQFQATEPVIRAFEKFAYEPDFNDFIKYLHDRATTLAIMAVGQRDETLLRWMGGRSQELFEIVAMFSERKILRQTEEFLGDSGQDDPLAGVE